MFNQLPNSGSPAEQKETLNDTLSTTERFLSVNPEATDEFFLFWNFGLRKIRPEDEAKINYIRMQRDFNLFFKPLGYASGAAASYLLLRRIRRWRFPSGFFQKTVFLAGWFGLFQLIGASMISKRMERSEEEKAVFGNYMFTTADAKKDIKFLQRMVEEGKLFMPSEKEIVFETEDEYRIKQIK